MDNRESRFKKLEELDFNDMIELERFIKRLYENFAICMDEEDYLTIKNGLRHILEIMEK